jgi:hypothetical protein
MGGGFFFSFLLAFRAGVNRNGTHGNGLHFIKGGSNRGGSRLVKNIPCLNRMLRLIVLKESM